MTSVKAPTVVFADRIIYGDSDSIYNVGLSLNLGKEIIHFTNFKDKFVEAVYDSDNNPMFLNLEIEEYKHIEVPEYLKGLQVVFKDNVTYKWSSSGHILNFSEEKIEHFEDDLFKVIFDNNGDIIWEDNKYVPWTPNKVAGKAIGSIEEIMGDIREYECRTEVMMILSAAQIALKGVGSMELKYSDMENLTKEQIIQIVRLQDKEIEEQKVLGICFFCPK